MMNTRFLRAIALLLVLTAAACVTTVPTTQPMPDELRMFVDPRTAYPATVQPRVDRQFSRAWSLIAAGSLDEAEVALAELLRGNPEYAPASLAQALIAVIRGNHKAAATIVERVRSSTPGYVTADVYAAEIAYARGDVETAFRTYEKIPAEWATARREELRAALFDQWVAEASKLSDDAAVVARLRAALQLRPDATAIRMQLVNRLIAMRAFDEALTEAEPLLRSSVAESDEFQAALAEIEFGKGRFEDSIARYERLARRNDAYRTRLDEIKARWTEANMPIQYRRAVEVGAITRADLAVLVFWTVDAVRFASNVGQPQIAVDVSNVIGREELVRAIALGLVQVDPVTRKVDPYRQVTGTVFMRAASRLMMMRGVPSCAAGAGSDPEPLRSQRLLAACGVPVSAIASAPEGPVSGKAASAALRAVDALLSSPE